MLEARSEIYINRINLDEMAWETRQAPGDFGYVFKNIDPLIGARHLGYQVVRLDPGRKGFPLHFHHFEEELGVVLEGTCTMRTSRGDFALRKGDFIAFPPGPNGDHQYINEGTEPCTMLLLSNVVPSDVSEYPDSNKVNMRGVRQIFRRDEAVDYWDREGIERELVALELPFDTACTDPCRSAQGERFLEPLGRVFALCGEHLRLAGSTRALHSQC